MKLLIERDEHASSPSEWRDTSLFLVANHRQFYVPVPGEKKLPQYGNEVADRFAKTHHIFGLEAYIHSGVVLALRGEGNFPDRMWDVSQLGYVFVSKAEWKNKADARKAALALIEEWNQYLSGDVWGYIVQDDEGNDLESCWGFYGEEAAREEGESMLKALEKREAEQLEKAKYAGQTELDLA